MLDWGKKKDALSVYFGAYGIKDLVTKVLGKDGTFDEIKSLTDAMQKWDDNPAAVPRAAGKLFLSRLEQTLRTDVGDVAASQIIAQIFSGPYEKFYDAFPEMKRRVMPWPSNRTKAEFGTGAYTAIYAPVIAPKIDASLMLKNGRVDQKYHYLNHDSAALWRGVIDSLSYKQYHECVSALEILCAQSIWHKFFSTGSSDGIVSLGGGSPSKDLLLIDSLLTILPESEFVHYALVDFSHCMLVDSMRLIEATLVGQNKRIRTNLFFIEEDFLALPNDSRLRRPGKNVAWMIPGGTIGNLDEPMFFSSIAKRAAQGDLLVIGVDTINAGDKSAVIDAAGKYDSPAVTRFIEGPLRQVWHELKTKEDLQSAIATVKTVPVSGALNTYSAVQDAVTLEISITVGAKKIVLATSTRYVVDGLIATAKQFGFEHQQTVSSRIGSTFKHLVFRVS